MTDDKTTSSDTENVNLDQLRLATEAQLVREFGRDAEFVVAAPGRVNLIGEHIDYNDGFVLPLAIERYVVMAACKSDAKSQNSIRIHSSNLGSVETISLTEPIVPDNNKGWISYLKGVIAGFVELGGNVPAFDAVVSSNVPLGGGLSSSAALEVAMATLLERLTGRQIGLSEKALLCQTAEREFAGVPCGIMDQFSSVFGQAGELMLIDCWSQKVTPVPMDSGDISVLITNSNVKHELTGGEYSQRRSQCDAALKKLAKTTWRDVTLEDVRHHADVLTEVEFRRSRHVVTEIQRTLQAAEALRTGDWHTVGKLMYASHESLRDDFEVSCPELDALVDIALKLGTENGMIGSRMTGGGFGGCTVSLVNNENLDAIIDKIISQYECETGKSPDCFSSRPARGAHVMKG